MIDQESRIPSTEAAALGRQIGRVRLEKLLGQGGMGEVYEGFDEGLQRRVAVKTIRTERRFDAETRARFLREARILSRLDHPGICRIFDLIEGDDNDYLILELAQGETLADLMRAGELAWDDKLRIAERVAEALAAAHAAKVVHRDLKPENVMVNAAGEVKVLDFGISRTEDTRPAETVPEPAEAGTTWIGDPVREPPPHTTEQLFSHPLWHDFETHMGSMIGTLRYMSPEQVQGLPIRPAGDLYSLGIVLQELFTGQPAYPDLQAGMSQRIAQVSAARTRPIEALDPALTRLIQALTHLDPDRRPTAEEARRELRAIRLRPERQRRLRRRWALGLGILLLVVLTAAVTYLQGPARSSSLVKDGAPLRLAVLPILNESGDPTLDWVELGLRSLLAESLDDLEGVRVIRDSTVREALDARGHRGHGSATTTPAVLTLAADLDADAILAPRLLRREGENLILEAQIFGPEGPDTTVGVPAADPTHAVRLLSERLQRTLGLASSLRAGERAFAQDPLVTRLYAMGVQRLEAAGGPAAEPFFRVCVDLEPDFASARVHLGKSLVTQGRMEEAQTLSEALRDEAVERGNLEQEGAALVLLAQTHWLQHHPEPARDAMERVLTISRTRQDRELEVEALTYLASIANHDFDDPDTAEALLLQAMTLERQVGHPWGVAAALFTLGVMQDQQGEPATARETLLEALRIYRELGSRSREARTLNSLGVVASNLGEWDRAADYYRQAVETHRAMGNLPSLSLGLSNQATVHLAQGTFEAAVPLLEEAYRTATEVDYPEGKALAAINRMHLATLRGEVEIIARFLPESEDFYGEVWEVRLAEAALAAAAGDRAAAARAVRAARRDAGEQWGEREEAAVRRILP